MFSSRRIGKAAFRDVVVRFVAADTHPDHDTVATFRREHQAAFAAAIASVLEMARELRAQPEADIAAPMARAEAVDEVDEARVERVPGEVARREALKAKRAAARARGRVAKTDAGNHADRGGQGKYKRRKCTVEPVFGILGNVLGFNRFHLGGIENVKAEGFWPPWQTTASASATSMSQRQRRHDTYSGSRSIKSDRLIGEGVKNS